MEHFSEFVPGSRCAAEYSETTIPPPPPWSTQATSMFRWIPLRTQPALMTQPVRPSLGAPRHFTNCSSPPLLLLLLLLAGSRRTMSPTRYSCQMGTARIGTRSAAEANHRRVASVRLYNIYIYI